jgi:uncharacterized protein YcbX
MPGEPAAPIADFNLDAVATVLFVYPVKACAGVPVETLALDERGGAVGDRRWAVVDAKGEVTWQGACPRLALVQPRPTAAGLALTADGFADVDTPPEHALRACSVKIWNDALARHDTFDAADAGDAVAAWLAEVVGAGLRLIRLGDQAVTRDGPAALHVVLAASAAAVDAHLGAAGHPPADLRRYRPNIVLSAAAGQSFDAFVEDTVQAFEWQGRASPTRLEITSPCIRCVVPNVDPASARVEPATLQALQDLSQRRHPGGPTTFGVYARGVAGARLRAGDSVRLELAF